MTGLRNAIGILRETRSRLERRAPLVPDEVRALVSEGFAVQVERSPHRAFRDDEYLAAGAEVVDDVTSCRFLVGVKEVSAERVRPGHVVMCFSHTIKGQAHNMPLLAQFISQGATLIDYEVIVDDRGERQVAFGRYAGLAGTHETLWTLGRRLAAQGHPSALTAIRHAVEYPDLDAMLAETRDALAALRREGPEALGPFVVGVTGSGRVSQGALDYLDRVGAIPCTLRELIELRDVARDDRTLRVFHLTGDMIYQCAATKRYDRGRMQAHPEQYACVGSMYLPYMTALVNGLYWDERFPRLLDDATARRLYRANALPPVIGDVACDLRGGVEWTVMATSNESPAFVYDPATQRPTLGVEGPGVAIMSVDNLPTALPRDASGDFSRAVSPYVRTFFRSGLTEGLNDIPTSLRPAVIVAGGHLTPRHQGLARYL